MELGSIGVRRRDDGGLRTRLCVPAQRLVAGIAERAFGDHSHISNRSPFSQMSL